MYTKECDGEIYTNAHAHMHGHTHTHIHTCTRTPTHIHTCMHPPHTTYCLLAGIEEILVTDGVIDVGPDQIGSETLWRFIGHLDSIL